MNSHHDVVLIVGSGSDVPIVKKTDLVEIFRTVEVSWEGSIFSAHRNFEELPPYLRKKYEEGTRVYIGAAGWAAHLAGVITAVLPDVVVIGVPLGGEAGPIHAISSLLSTLDMPPGKPVATVGSDNFANAAILACQVLAIGDPGVWTRLKKYQKDHQRKCEPGLDQTLFAKPKSIE